MSGNKIEAHEISRNQIETTLGITILVLIAILVSLSSRFPEILWEDYFWGLSVDNVSSSVDPKIQLVYYYLSIQSENCLDLSGAALNIGGQSLRHFGAPGSEPAFSIGKANHNNAGGCTNLLNIQVDDPYMNGPRNRYDFLTIQTVSGDTYHVFGNMPRLPDKY